MAKEYDSNMIHKNADVNGLVYHDVRTEKEFEVYGFYDYRNTERFQRLPDNVAESVSPTVQALHLETAGGRVRFSTDSKKISVKAKFGPIGPNARTPMLGICGFDLYVDTSRASRFRSPFTPPNTVEDEYEISIEFPEKFYRSYTLNFPYHACVNDLYIGLDGDARLDGGMKYINDKPVVFYGSSITHGSCASRPGMIYENILSRRFNLDYLCFGFSGSAHGEKEIAEYMAGLDMSMFVCDYDYNACDEEELFNTHRRMYDIIRASHPSVPYLMISKPDFCFRHEFSYKRREIIFDTYRYACSLGDKNVYYIDGSSIYRGRSWDDYTVDTIHPNDAGFIKIADAVEPIIQKALSHTDIDEL